MRKGRQGIIWDAFPVPEEGVQTWEQCKKQTAVAKPFVAPISAVDPVARETFGATDVIWFLDNTTALSCLINTGAKRRDMASLAMLAQVSLHSAGIRPYYKWVRSEANIADAPSRGLRPSLPPGLHAKQLKLNINWGHFTSAFESARAIIRQEAQ